MKGYGQYCPIAKAAEVFAERWTPLVIRNLYLGAETFSEILEGVPRMSRTLPADRLRALERQGVGTRQPIPPRGSRYRLTQAGHELADVCLALGAWGARWMEVAPVELDPGLILWAWKRLISADRLPARRVVVRFGLTDRPRDRFWLLLARDDVELCVRPPGLDEDLVVSTDAATLLAVHMGRLALSDAERQGRWRMEGPPDLMRAFPTWGGLSPFADVEPARAG